MAEPAKTKASPSRQVADRWTPNLAKQGWTPISDFFLDNYHRLQPPLKYSEAMFVIHLMRHKWDRNAPYPGFGTLAARMGISPEAARLHARSLEKKGYLYREMQIGQTNKFHMDSLFAALEKLLAQDTVEKASRTTHLSANTSPVPPPAAMVPPAAAKPLTHPRPHFRFNRKGAATLPQQSGSKPG